MCGGHHKDSRAPCAPAIRHNHPPCCIHVVSLSLTLPHLQTNVQSEDINPKTRIIGKTLKTESGLCLHNRRRGRWFPSGLHSWFIPASLKSSCRTIKTKQWCTPADEEARHDPKRLDGRNVKEHADCASHRTEVRRHLGRDVYKISIFWSRSAEIKQSDIRLWHRIKSMFDDASKQSLTSGLSIIMCFMRSLCWTADQEQGQDLVLHWPFNQLATDPLSGCIWV